MAYAKHSPSTKKEVKRKGNKEEGREGGREMLSEELGKCQVGKEHQNQECKSYGGEFYLEEKRLKIGGGGDFLLCM